MFTNAFGPNKAQQPSAPSGLTRHTRTLEERQSRDVRADKNCSNQKIGAARGNLKRRTGIINMFRKIHAGVRAHREHFTDTDPPSQPMRARTFDQAKPLHKAAAACGLREQCTCRRER